MLKASVDKYISELLFEHNCVIIPGFGGFVANYASTTVHPVQHTFQPPKKQIAFNRKLQNNDGFLANHIVLKENKTYAEALKILSDYAANASAILKNGKRFEIKEVGALFSDVEKNWQFEPASHINYLIDSFGLSEFQSPAIKRDNLHQRLEKQFKDRPPIPQEIKRSRLKKYWPVMALLPVAFLAVWLPANSNITTSENFNYSSFNVFASESVLYEARPAQALILKVEALETESSDIEFSFIESLPVKEEIVIPTIIKEEKEKKEEIAPEITENKTVKVENSTSKEASFYIIGGCFQELENAAKFVSEINAEGYEAVLLTPSKGLHPVAYSKHTSEKEARNSLKKIRAKHPDAWLMKKK